ncbi:hypothetical protein QE428_000428 [Microbacterium sp. SORGH_AS 505]|nr:hypothetical protein [Microbacterium sp. SORGH_AS_0505]
MSVLPYMPSETPKGNNLIGELDGDPTEVKTRGQQIVDLGNQMADAWALIERLVADGAEMEGNAVEKLREVSGEVSSDLSQAASLYAAVGPHIQTYGGALEDSKATIDPIVSRLRNLWDEYYELSRDADTAAGAVPRKPDDDADADEQSAYNDANTHAQSVQGQADAKKGEWDAAAGEYDDAWDTWHDAFTTAAANIREGVSGKIEDSTSDDIRGALEFLSNVLAVAGIVLAVLAVVIGGPIIAALAAIVAVATLVVALTRKLAYNDGSWVDVAFGVIGVVPFLGPAAKGIRGLTQAGGGQALLTSFGDDAVRLFGVGRGGMSNYLSGLNGLRGATFVDRAADFSAGLLTGRNIAGWGSMGSGAGAAVDTMATVWSAQLSLVGQIRDTANGAFAGAFDPDQNPFS